MEKVHILSARYHLALLCHDGIGLGDTLVECWDIAVVCLCFPRSAAAVFDGGFEECHQCLDLVRVLFGEVVCFSRIGIEVDELDWMQAFIFEGGAGSGF